jgi:glycolate oxidase iron-sulfur subunit
MAAAVEACVHCGFCLPACPTYLALGEEMDSPRGRIVLMKGVLEGDLEMDQVLPHVDRCLGCLGCVSACPSGVAYGDLLIPFRARAEEVRKRPLAERFTRALVARTLPFPRRFRAAARLAGGVRPMRRLMPGRLRGMLDLLPQALPAQAPPLPPTLAAFGQRRARVALLTGCAQQVLAPSITLATARVLTRNGVEVIVPAGQGCCGALAIHAGRWEQARQFARRNLGAFDPADVDAIVTDAAGCGSGMHDYPMLFEGEALEPASRAFAGKVRDASAFLAELGALAPDPLPEPATIAYHDACHLAHAQGVRAGPRSLLGAIPNVTLVEVPGGEICCGSAGTYNLEHPEIAATLGRRKARSIVETGASIVASGNIGCTTQIRAHLQEIGADVRVLHTMEILEMAYGGGA